MVTQMKMQSLGRTGCTALVSLFFLAFACSIHAEEKQKKLPTVKNAKDGAEMILIAGGSLLMGSTRSEIDAQFRDTGLPEEWKKHTLDEQPRHRRTVQPFYIYKYEVTNAQYERFIDATGHRPPTGRPLIGKGRTTAPVKGNIQWLR